MPSDVSLHVTRVPLNGSSREELLRMAERVEAAATLLSHAKPNVIAFHCTAVSPFSDVFEGEILRQAAASARCPAIATSQAILADAAALHVRRIALVTPYIEEINQRDAAFFGQHGLECVAEHGPGLLTPAEVFDVSPARWLDLLRSWVPDEAEAVLLGCTAIRVLQLVDAAEALLGRPVLTSNQATGWLLRRQLGIHAPLLGFGRLLSPV
ncbi:arylmalonate decarboxylase [Roseomonas sp. KE2513]|uniref:maleate cis-trans isomerase family protein n=1 Tax=Roseomonas sp. KE2513 TaxID=2479202 RepID=UPI0018DFB338|nr:aspartate/glutamate racemase family protein [Roseomonas sp. KE2513]MBI0539200.1 arylmalonate decarboxylase [Roseomonas sp. KE2513]